MSEPAGRITVGEIRGVYGVRGWVKLYSYTDPRENLLSFSGFDGPRGEHYVLVEGRQQGKSLIARLEGVDDRDAALALNGTVLSVPRSALPETDEDEFYWSDLIGCEVETSAGEKLGRVETLLETGAHDVLVIHDPSGRQTLVPFVMDVFVLAVDLAARCITVEWAGMDDDGDNDHAAR